jgi:hypothetical protein
MSVHDRLEIDRWVREFPLSRLREEARAYVLHRRQQLPQNYPDQRAVDDHIQLMEPKWEIVVGPGTVAVNEQLRAEYLAGAPYRGRRVPVDVAVWAEGESPDRACTKIGGLPYRPADVPWPTDSRGQNMRFVAQLCFADSRDLVPRLPGDVLLVFGDDDALLAEPEGLVLEWWPLGIEALPSEVPACDEALAPLHAQLHRTEDWEQSVYEGTKIGGTPQFIQDDPSMAGAFIGAIGSISVPSDQRHPFVNVAEPRDWSRENDLMIGDMGSLYLFLQTDGSVQASSQCY